MAPLRPGRRAGVGEHAHWQRHADRRLSRAADSKWIRRNRFSGHQRTMTRTFCAARTSVEHGDSVDRTQLRLSGDYSIDKSNGVTAIASCQGCSRGRPFCRTCDTIPGLRVPDQEVEAYGMALDSDRRAHGRIEVAQHHRLALGRLGYERRLRLAADRRLGRAREYKNEQTSEDCSSCMSVHTPSRTASSASTLWMPTQAWKPICY